VALQPEGVNSNQGWTIQRAEELLESLPGVISVRVVARPGGKIEEIHLLTTTEVSAKQSVRNVESALRAQFHLEVDHRKISVAQTSDPPPARKQPETRAPVLIERFAPTSEARILFRRHQVEMGRAHSVKVAVCLEWAGAEYVGEAAGTESSHSRLETAARATLAATQKILATLRNGASDEEEVALGLDGVRVVEAFDRDYVLVGVNAIHEKEIASLAGASVVAHTLDRAAILATLQATDRWVRGRI
jgi:plasmid stabilization system protein ParE